MVSPGGSQQGRAERRLKELGIELPNASPPAWRIRRGGAVREPAVPQWDAAGQGMASFNPLGDWVKSSTNLPAGMHYALQP